MMSGENNNRTTTKTNVVPPSCNAKRWFLQCKSMVFARQKPYFCSTKRWFFAKHCHTNSYAILFFSYFVPTVGIAISLCIFTVTHVFPRSLRRRRVRFIVLVSTKFPEMVLRFPPLVLQFIVPHPRNSTKWRCNSHHFDTLKPFGLD